MKTIKKQEFEVSVIEGTKYITTIYRGTEYMIHNLSNDWFVSTRRVGLGSMHVGGGKYYRTLAEVSEKCKAFKDNDKLVSLVYGF